MYTPPVPRQIPVRDPVRPRPAAPGQDPHPTVPAQAARGGGRGWLALSACLLLVTGALAFPLLRGEPQPDPHYLKGRDAVAGYELGRDLLERDYDGAVYRDALKELGLVDPASISAEPAAQLARDINRRTDEFHARLRARQEDMAARERSRSERDQAVAVAHMRDVLHPQTSFPECREEEERGHRHAEGGGHGH